mmetsp:Transcript_53149/g.121120  ORF Transcript_53149/g.121120 Transcript_53149/m.121120 type:complete len:217 (-) Transcript_53149:683-1333(-)
MADGHARRAVVQSKSLQFFAHEAVWRSAGAVGAEVERLAKLPVAPLQGHPEHLKAELLVQRPRREPGLPVLHVQPKPPHCFARRRAFRFDDFFALSDGLFFLRPRVVAPPVGPRETLGPLHEAPPHPNVAVLREHAQGADVKAIRWQLMGRQEKLFLRDVNHSNHPRPVLQGGEALQSLHGGRVRVQGQEPEPRVVLALLRALGRATAAASAAKEA